MQFILEIKWLLKIKIFYTYSYRIASHIYIFSRIMALMLTDVTIRLLGMVTKHVIPCQHKMKVAKNLSYPSIFKERVSRWTNCY